MQVVAFSFIAFGYYGLLITDSDRYHGLGGARGPQPSLLRFLLEYSYMPALY